MSTNANHVPRMQSREVTLKVWVHSHDGSPLPADEDIAQAVANMLGAARNRKPPELRGCSFGGMVSYR